MNNLVIKLDDDLILLTDLNYLKRYGKLIDNVSGDVTGYYKRLLALAEDREEYELCPYIVSRIESKL